MIWHLSAPEACAAATEAATAQSDNVALGVTLLFIAAILYIAIKW